jgi:hypothetical protein
MTDNALLDSTPILVYREFFDIPRAFIIEPSPGLFLLFDCPFDENADDYSNTFSVYTLPIATVGSLPLDWRTIPSRGEDPVGRVAVSEIKFDITRRKEVRIEKLGALVSAAEHLSGVKEV